MATLIEKIPYYTVIKGTGYWRPPGWARKPPHDMEGMTCGPDGPEARAKAHERNALMKRLRVSGEVTNLAPLWPKGSLGSFYEKWTSSLAFSRKPAGTRHEYEQIWPHVSLSLKMKLINKITPADVERLQVQLENTSTAYTRWRTIKKLRSIFNAANKYGLIAKSPAVTMPNPQPPPRNNYWVEMEVRALIDKADALGKPDMALAIDLLWATMLSPVDVRTLTRAMVLKDNNGFYIHRPRTKVVDADVYVDLPDATGRRLQAYIVGTPTTLAASPILRGLRDGKAFRSRNSFAARFRVIREAAFPGDERQMRDLRRSASIEAALGGATAEERGAILANSIGTNARLELTYTPPTIVAARELRKQREAGRAMLSAVNH